jgi:hypothetical protein
MSMLAPASRKVVGNPSLEWLDELMFALADDGPKFIFENQPTVSDREEAAEDYLHGQSKVEGPDGNTRLTNLLIELTCLFLFRLAAGLEVVARALLVTLRSAVEVNSKADAPGRSSEIRMINRRPRTGRPRNPDAYLQIELIEGVIRVVSRPGLREIDVRLHLEPAKRGFDESKRQRRWDGETTFSALVQASRVRFLGSVPRTVEI